MALKHIAWSDADLWPTGSSGINISDNLVKIWNFWFKKMHLEMLSAKWQPFKSRSNVLILVLLKLKHTGQTN